MPAKRKNITKKEFLLVMQRDNWHCRYCGRAVFFSPTLKLLEQLSPNHLYYHRNGKEGLMISEFQWGWASVDHINPVIAGGTNEISNYAASCWQCNLKLRDKINEQGKQMPNEIKKSDWDGFVGLYPKLMELMGKKEDGWIRLIKK